MFDLPLFVLFAAVALGLGLGSIRVLGVSLGASGVFFVALMFGIGGLTVPHAVTELGLLLFVFAVGLQNGPRFFSIFRARGKQFLLAGIGSITAGAIAALVLARVFGLSPALAAGLYSGATTCTPALAAAMDAASDDDPAQQQVVSVGYGIAYPFSLIGVVLFVQLLPFLVRKRPEDAAAEAREEEAATAPPLRARLFQVENPSCAGKTVSELQALGITDAKISRIRHANDIRPALPDAELHLGDTIQAVGTEEELAKAAALIGRPVGEEMTDPEGRVVSRKLLVSRAEAVGRTLRELGAWEHHGVVVTRVQRQGIEFSPSVNFRLDLGDTLRVVGAPQDLEMFAHRVGGEEKRLDETTLVPLAIGIVVGVLVGLIPIPLPWGLMTQLGVGGGAFVVALLLGRLGHVGPLYLYVPNAAKYLARELGLVLFLAGAGTGAGLRFIEVLKTAGPQLLFSGAVISVVTAGTAFLILHALLGWNMLATAGAVCSCMTNPAGLAAASRLADSDAAAVGFASVYPVALVGKIVLAQLIYAVASAGTLPGLPGFTP
ncbi:MAG: hypothetical protein KBD01_14950 [Acidobacteria bacterium]|nr:hypothetical protein [Acidobacteriota bacterium]